MVTATGLNLQVFGGTELIVDGETVEPHETMAYRAMMLSGVPNFAFTIGYTNASWTLKADLVAEYVVRLLSAHATPPASRIVVPVRDESVAEVPLMDFDAGYVQRLVAHAAAPGHRGAVGAAGRTTSTTPARSARAKLDDGVLRWS